MRCHLQHMQHDCSNVVHAIKQPTQLSRAHRQPAAQQLCCCHAVLQHAQAACPDGSDSILKQHLFPECRRCGAAPNQLNAKPNPCTRTSACRNSSSGSGMTISQSQGGAALHAGHRAHVTWISSSTLTHPRVKLDTCICIMHNIGRPVSQRLIKSWTLRKTDIGHACCTTQYIWLLLPTLARQQQCSLQVRHKLPLQTAINSYENCQIADPSPHCKPATGYRDNAQHPLLVGQGHKQLASDTAYAVVWCIQLAHQRQPSHNIS